MFPTDMVYASSIFTWSGKIGLPPETITGGSGFDLGSTLSPEIDGLDCDYSIYPAFTKAIGFLTRGCNRRCPWCIVPEKEGKLQPYADIEQIAQGRKEIILLDNNVLGIDYGLEQIEKIIRLGLKVDFNQGLDARMITPEVADLLAKVKWLTPLRMACDTDAMLDEVIGATALLRKAGCKPIRYSVYVMVRDIPSALNRVENLRVHNLDPFAQPYREGKDEPSFESKRFARWVNHKATFKSVPWERYTG